MVFIPDISTKTSLPFIETWHHWQYQHYGAIASIMASQVTSLQTLASMHHCQRDSQHQCCHWWHCIFHRIGVMALLSVSPSLLCYLHHGTIAKDLHHGITAGTGTTASLLVLVWPTTLTLCCWHLGHSVIHSDIITASMSALASWHYQYWHHGITTSTSIIESMPMSATQHHC